MKRQGINIENDTKLMKQFMELMREEQRRIEQKNQLGADRHEQQENHTEIK